MTIKINFVEILTKAWQTTWKFRVLWIFGILAGCAGNNNNFNFNTGGSRNSGNSGNNPMDQFFPQFQSMPADELFGKFMSQYLVYILIFFSLICLLGLLFFFLGLMGKVGLIKGARKAEAGASSMSFAELWTESLPYFLRMFGLNFLVGLPFFLLIVILLVILGVGGLSAFKTGMSGGSLVALIIGMSGFFIAVMCVVTIFSIIVGMIVQQAQNALVIEELGVLDSLRRGWNVFKTDWLSIVILAIILSIIGGVAGFIIAIPMLIVLLPAGIGMAVTSGSAGMAIPLILGGCCFVILLPFILLASGIIQTFTQSAWTLAYLRLTAPPTPPSPVMEMGTTL